jgi:hypothetical protein
VNITDEHREVFNRLKPPDLEWVAKQIDDSFPPERVSLYTIVSLTADRFQELRTRVSEEHAA